MLGASVYLCPRRVWAILLTRLVGRLLGLERPNNRRRNFVEEGRLVECPDCGGSVSRRAASCPRCGCPVASVSSAKVQVTRKVAVVSGVLASIAVFLDGEMKGEVTSMNMNLTFNVDPGRHVIEIRGGRHVFSSEPHSRSLEFTVEPNDIVKFMTGFGGFSLNPLQLDRV